MLLVSVHASTDPHSSLQVPTPDFYCTDTGLLKFTQEEYILRNNWFYTYIMSHI